MTLRRPRAPTCSASRPTTAQHEAGLGAYAYHELGWRRAAVVADDANPGWAGAAAFTAEFCALGGTDRDRLRRITAGRSDRGAASAARPDGVAAFVESSTARCGILGRSPRSSTARAARSCSEPRTSSSPRCSCDRRRALDGVVVERLASVVAAVAGAAATTGGAGAARSRASRARSANALGRDRLLQRRSRRTLAALERAALRRRAARLQAELARAAPRSPGGPGHASTGNRQAVRDGYLSRIVDHGRQARARAGRGRAGRRADLRRAASSAPPPGRRQPAVPAAATPPAWAR